MGGFGYRTSWVVCEDTHAIPKLQIARICEVANRNAVQVLLQRIKMKRYQNFLTF